MLKLIIAYLRNIKTLWCLIVIIAIKHNLTWPWKQCIHINHPSMHRHTGNVCCVVVPISHALIYQANNKIGIIQKHLLQYIFMFITSFHVLQCMEDCHWMKRFFSPVFAWSCFCATYKNIHNKRACYYGGIYCWLPHKFLHSRNTKISVPPPTCMNYRDTSLWQHTPRSIQTL